MANVFFKRGLHSALPTQSADIVDGAFYLTTDTNRLYVGKQGTNGNILVELNQSINSVPTIANLPSITLPTGTTAQDVGQFYYVEDANILCVYRAKGTTPETYEWKQINPDTRLKTVSQNTSVTSGTNSATVESIVEEDLSTNAHTSTGSFIIQGGSNQNGDNLLNVSVSGNTITLTPNITNITSDVNTTYTIGTSGTATTGTPTANSSVNVNLDASSNGTDSHITIQGTNAASVSQASDVITVNVANPVAKTEAAFESDGSISINTTVNNISSANNSVNLVPVIKLGGTDTDNLNSNGYKFLSGEATLPVYTKKEVKELVENRLQAADAMTFKGVLDSSAAATAALVTNASSAQVGDTYKMGTTISSPVAAKTGDLVIATGTDGNVTWVAIPSGDDQVLVGTASQLGIEITDSNNANAELAGFDLVAGTGIDLSGSVDNKHTTITISQDDNYTAQHNNDTGRVGASASNVTQTAKNSATFTAVTEIETDAYGNVVDGSIKTQTFTVVDTHNTLSEISVDAVVDSSSGVDTATFSIGASDSDSSSITSGNIVLKSRTIAMTESDDQVTMELVWGTF